MMKTRLTSLILTLLCVLQSGCSPERQDIEQLCDRLAAKYDVAVHFDNFPTTTWRLGHALAEKGDYAKLRRYLRMFDEEFGRYPERFCKRSGLTAVVFVKSLAYQGQLRTAVPDYGQEILILDFARGDHNRVYQRHCIHHEFYHMIEEQFNDSAYWKDPDWASLNDPEFAYGDGGVVAQTTNSFPMTHPQPGFLNRYSMSGLEEDKAEIFAALFVRQEREKLIQWSEDDAILRRKVQYMKRFLRSLDVGFDVAYWTKLDDD